MIGITVIKANVAHPLTTVVLDSDGDFATGLTVNYEIRKISDDSLIESGVLVEQSSVYVKFITMTDLTDFVVKYTTPTDYENGAEQLAVREYDTSDVMSEVQIILEKTCKILGLSQSNILIENQTYQTFGDRMCLTGAKTTIYPTALDLQNNTNPIQSYQMVAIYDVQGKLIKYTMEEI